MNFKIIVYNCLCRFVYITDPEKQIFKNSYLCPVHRKSKKHTIIYCAKCHIKIVQPNARAAAKQKWCCLCSLERDHKRSRNYSYEHKEKYYKPAEAQTEVEKPPTQRELAGKAIDRWYNELRFVPPTVKTPILDGMINENIDCV